MLLWSLIVISLQTFITQGEETDGDCPAPTLKPGNFSAKDDVQVFINELNNKGRPNPENVTEIWFQRTQAERIEINNNYNLYIQNPLRGSLDEFDKEVYGLFDQSFWPPPNLLGWTLNSILELNSGEPPGALEEIMCGTEKDVKDKINEYYTTVHEGTTVEAALAEFRKEKYPEYHRVMDQHCWKGLCQDKAKIKPEDAEREAKELRDILPTSPEEKDRFLKKITDLFDKNCVSDLKMIFDKYPNDNKDDGIVIKVQNGIDDERLSRAYDYLVRYILDVCAFYAEELGKAMEEEGDHHELNYDKINRIILIRSEKDLECILKKYQENHQGKPFIEDLKSKKDIKEEYVKAIGYLCNEKSEK